MSTSYRSGARGPERLPCFEYNILKCDSAFTLPCFEYNVLKWDSAFTLGLNTAKITDKIKKNASDKTC